MKFCEHHKSTDGKSIRTEAFGAIANLLYKPKKDYRIFGDPDRLK